MKKARYLLETGVLIRHLRDSRDAVRLVRTLGEAERLAVATVTRLEVHAGMLPKESYKTQKLLSRFITYDLDADIADRAGDYVRECRAEGTTLSVPDAIIAATATRHRLTLVTFNPKHFPIPGLSLFPLESTESPHLG
ncbi:MAG: type II toxin-antitoxin system VapC family toxin [Anaerolineae bacterium]